MKTDNTTPQKNAPSNMPDLVEVVKVCLRKWHWFAIAAAVAILVGLVVYKAITPTYERSMKVLVKDDQNDNSVASSLNRLSSFGVFTNSSNVSNEIQALTSYDIMDEVVSRLDLDVEYTVAAPFHRQMLYGEENPLRVEFLDLQADDEARLDVEILEDHSSDAPVKLSHWRLNGDRLKAKPMTVRAGDTVETPFGCVTVNFLADCETVVKSSIRVEKNSRRKTVLDYLGELQASQTDKQADVIRLAILDPSSARADDILLAIRDVYDDQQRVNKSQVAANTTQFINERLSVIEEELSGFDASISSYKSSNMVPDVQTAASLYMHESSTLNTQIMDINNQLSMARYIREYLADESNANNPIPSISGVSNASVERQITEYNEQMLKRNNLAAHSSEKNSLVVSADRTLVTLRKSILASMDNTIYALNSQLKNLQKGEAKVNARIAANPTQAKNLLSEERQQTVKESLYLYLLQKREENELSQAFLSSNIRVIEHPTGALKAKTPRAGVTLILALLAGIALPALVIILKMMAGNKIAKAEEAELEGAVRLGILPRKGKDEAMALLCTNLEMFAADKEIKTLLVTSLEPGGTSSDLAGDISRKLTEGGNRVHFLNDQEKGGAARMAELMEKEIGNYDYAVVDLPNITESSEARLMAAKVDCILFVVECGKTRRDSLKKAQDILTLCKPKNTALVVCENGD